MWRLLLASLLASINLSAKETGVIVRKVAMDKKFILKQSERAIVANKFEIRLLKIIEDSRCPSDVQCGMAGRAIGVFAISIKRAAPTNIQIAVNPDNATVRYLNYDINFMDLTPYPLSTKASSQNAQFDVPVSRATETLTRDYHECGARGSPKFLAVTARALSVDNLKTNPIARRQARHIRN